jgi:hypothetical protein
MTLLTASLNKQQNLQTLHIGAASKQQKPNTTEAAVGMKRVPHLPQRQPHLHVVQPLEMRFLGPNRGGVPTHGAKAMTTRNSRNRHVIMVKLLRPLEKKY